MQGWSLDAADHYQPLASNEQGWLWSETLGLWLGTWSGIIYRETAEWLRFYDQEGNLVPLPEEAAQQQVEATQQQVLRQGALRQLLRLLTVRFVTLSLQKLIFWAELKTPSSSIPIFLSCSN